MTPASTVGEAPIPLPPPPAEGQGEPAPAPQALTPEAIASVHAALMRMVWLYLYVTIMGLFGYRMRRQRRKGTRPADRSARPRTTSQAAPPKPRRKHRYLDRDMVLGVFAGINRDVNAAMAQPAPVDPAPPIADAAPASQPRVAAPLPPNLTPPNLITPNLIPIARPAARRARGVSPCARATWRPHPPPFSKPSLPDSPTHAHFVTIS